LILTNEENDGWIGGCISQGKFRLNSTFFKTDLLVVMAAALAAVVRLMNN
jgi:hypothetical protein